MCGIFGRRAPTAPPEAPLHARALATQPPAPNARARPPHHPPRYANYGAARSVQAILDCLFDGLQRLEYRGYDSAGVCVDAPTASGGAGLGPLVIKHQGKISDLRARAAEVFSENAYCGAEVHARHVGIGHTRWATHGPPSAINSHPHVSGANGEFVVVHNGIITNYAEKHGAVFVSETDTEVVPHLCEYLWQRKGGKVSLHQLAMEVCSRLEGAYALLIKSARYPDELAACKQGSPLVFGTKRAACSHNGAAAPAAGGEAGAQEVWLSSDSAALLAHTRDITDGDVLHLDGCGHARVFNALALTAGNLSAREDVSELRVVREQRTVEAEVESIMKGGYDHFMQKEIHEQPKTLADAMRGRVVIDKPMQPTASGAANILVSGAQLEPPASGAALLTTAAANGGAEGGFGLPRARAGAKSPSPSRPAADKLPAPPAAAAAAGAGAARGGTGFASAGGEGGEGAEPFIRLGGLEDHVEGILRCRRIVFIACGTSFHACLAARKTLEEFAAMPVVVELAGDFMAPVFRDDTCVFVSQSGETADTLRALDYAKAKGALCVGITNTVGSAISNATHCGVHLNAGYEIGVASTKVKEVALIHSEGINAGEMKHGPLALVDETLPIVVIATQDAMHRKMESVIHQLLARSAKLIILCNTGDAAMDQFEGRGCSLVRVPRTVDALQPVINVIPLQLLSYHLTTLRRAAASAAAWRPRGAPGGARRLHACGGGGGAHAKAHVRYIGPRAKGRRAVPSFLWGFNVDQPRNLAKSVTVTEE
ncbi:MAG: hypothetical protein J3K34DRAFT_458509 [Monoraphidium minutum]|nr:MAG: hypothetical protein J3K34DRAFT_458509 [Monoraphidium minutum]